MDVKAIQARLAQFAEERDWEQFHSPKNLSMALAGEAGELLEVFQWLTEKQSSRESLTAEQLNEVSDELADICDSYASVVLTKVGKAIRLFKRAGIQRAADNIRFAHQRCVLRSKIVLPSTR